MRFAEGEEGGAASTKETDESQEFYGRSKDEVRTAAGQQPAGRTSDDALAGEH